MSGHSWQTRSRTNERAIRQLYSSSHQNAFQSSKSSNVSACSGEEKQAMVTSCRWFGVRLPISTIVPKRSPSQETLQTSSQEPQPPPLLPRACREGVILEQEPGPSSFSTSARSSTTLSPPRDNLRVSTSKPRSCGDFFMLMRGINSVRRNH